MAGIVAVNRENIRMYLENVKRQIDKVGKEKLCCMNKENSVHDSKNCTLNLEIKKDNAIIDFSKAEEPLFCSDIMGNIHSMECQTTVPTVPKSLMNWVWIRHGAVDLFYLSLMQYQLRGCLEISNVGLRPN